jgi:hypothetical protein
VDFPKTPTPHLGRKKRTKADFVLIGGAFTAENPTTQDGFQLHRWCI